MLDQTFDRLQKLVSRLEILGKNISQEDVSQKLLRSLSPEWNTHVVWRNKADIDTMSMDDLYNNHKVTNGAVNTAQAVNTANEVSTASTQVNAALSTNIDNLSDFVIYTYLASPLSSPQLAHEDLEQIHLDDMDKMDLRWQMAMLTMSARRFLKKTGKKLNVNGNEFISFDKPKAEEGPNYALMAYTSLSSDSKLRMKLSEEKPKAVRKNNDAPIIKEWVSDNKEE
nr:hypothetical protein [Tanacetum cinerariifolium]